MYQVGDLIDGSELACEHWNFISKWLEMVYIDAFIHGFKHGVKHGEDEYIAELNKKLAASKGNR